MALTDPVDIYCERLGPGFWAEPINAITNLAFPLAALWALMVAVRLSRDTGKTIRPVDLTLMALAALIGLGSFLFHTFANRWSEWADTIPIWSFVGLYIYAAVTQPTSTKPRTKWITGTLLTLAVGYVLVSMANGEAADTNAVDPLNGSGQYAPALIALLIVSAITLWRRSPVAIWFALATVTFFLSLTFRTFDMRVCAGFATGTHFMWHVLNGLMIGLLLQARVRSARS